MREPCHRDQPDTCSSVHLILVTCRMRRNTRMGKGMCDVSPTEIKALLANNGTIANIERLKPSLQAFARSADDFAGLFITVQGPGKRGEKGYLCLFTWLASRAVHLEMAYGLDTDSFLSAFYRMASRRSVPEELFSDNGTNFRGVDAELKSLVKELDENKIKQSSANKGTTWNFNPPLAPHFGGVHKTMIKLAKEAIKAILCKANINNEDSQQQ